MSDEGRDGKVSRLLNEQYRVCKPGGSTPRLEMRLELQSRDPRLDGKVRKPLIRLVEQLSICNPSGKVGKPVA